MTNQDSDVAPSLQYRNTDSSWISEGKLREFVHFEWFINKFSSRSGRLISPPFSSQGNLDWVLKMYPNGWNTEGYISLYLHSLNASNVKAEFTFSLLFGDEEFSPKSGKMTNIFEPYPSIKCDFGYREWIRRYTFSKVTILCQLSASAVKSVKMPECCVLDDFNRLYETGKFSDVILIVDGQEFPVHKAILSARSPVFNDILELNMTKKESNQVVIEGIAADVFKEMLRFIYTDRVTNSEEMAVSLLVAADRYGLEGLKVICEEFIVDRLETGRSPLGFEIESTCDPRCMPKT